MTRQCCWITRKGMDSAIIKDLYHFALYANAAYGNFLYSLLVRER